jgi:hypothetical protein
MRWISALADFTSARASRTSSHVGQSLANAGATGPAAMAVPTSTAATASAAISLVPRVRSMAVPPRNVAFIIPDLQ